MNIYEKGFTLTEIMIAVGVVASLVIGGLNFYNHAVLKSQAIEAFPAGKVVIDDVHDYYARFSSLPGDSQNLGGDYIPAGDGYIALAKWEKGSAPVTFNENANWGIVTVEYRTAGVQQALAPIAAVARHVKFYLIESDFRSFVEYHGCTSNIRDGRLNSDAFVEGNSLGANPHHPVLPQCLFDENGQDLVK